MLVSYYLPGTSLAEPPSPREWGIPANEEAQHALFDPVPPGRGLGGSALSWAVAGQFVMLNQWYYGIDSINDVILNDFSFRSDVRSLEQLRVDWLVCVENICWLVKAVSEKSWLLKPFRFKVQIGAGMVWNLTQGEESACSGAILWTFNEELDWGETAWHPWQ